MERQRSLDGSVTIIDGSYYFVVDIDEGQKGPYDWVKCFGTPPHYHNEIPPQKRHRKYRSQADLHDSSPPRYVVLANANDGNTKQVVTDALAKNSNIVNGRVRAEDEGYTDDEKHRYQRNLRRVFHRLVGQLISHLRYMDKHDQPYVIACPLNGGAWTAAVIEDSARELNYPINRKIFTHIELKRVFTPNPGSEERTLWVGGRVGYMPDFGDKNHSLSRQMTAFQQEYL